MAEPPGRVLNLRGFVEAAHQSFLSATERAGGHERRYRIGGLPVRVRYAGQALPDHFDLALRPVASNDDGVEPALDIVAWDRATTGVPAPPPPWSVDDYLTRQRIRGVDPAVLRLTYETGAGLLQLHEPNAPSALFHALDAARVPWWVDRCPFRQLLGWWAGDHGLDFVHASGVGDVGSGRAVLIAGESGSGKSTTALLCAERGLGFIGDDLCLVDSSPATPVVHATYGVAKLEPDAAAMLPALAAGAVSVDGGQTLVEPSPLLRSAAVAAVLLPSVTGRAATVVRPATPKEALFAIAPSTLIEANGNRPSSLARLGRLVRAVPCFHLDLGSDLDGVADAVRGVLGAAGADG